jgi:hypothetical protein
MFAAHSCQRAGIEALLTAKADASLKDTGPNGGRSAADYLILGCKNNTDEAASLMLLLAKSGATVMRRDALGLLFADGAQPDVDALIRRTLAEK